MATIRNFRKMTVLVGLVLIAALSLTGLAQAKMIPYVEPLDSDWGSFDDYPMMTFEGSYFSGAYGRLGEPGDSDVLHMRFDTVPNDPVTVELMVPVCGEHFADFYPTLALIGPDLDMSEDVLDALPFDLPEGLGAQILEPDRPDEGDSWRAYSEWQLWEQTYYESLTIVFEVDTPAKYFFAIWDETDDTGAYTLYTGAEHPGPDVIDPEETEALWDEMLRDGEWMGVDCDEPDTDA